jgi:hypothetical protein
MKRALAAALFAGVILAPGAVAIADAPPPADLSLTYQGVLVVKVLDLTVDQTVTRNDYTAVATMRSSGVLSLFKKINVRAIAKGDVEAGRFQPENFEHTNRDGAANRHVQVRWTGEDVTTAALPAFPNLGDPPASRSQKLAAADPLTQLIRMTASPVQAGPCRDSARFFDGRQLYEVVFGAPTGRTLTPREIQLGLTSGVACPLTFSEVAGFDGKPAAKKNQGMKRPVSVEFARVHAGGPWVISAVRGATPLGEARIEVQTIRSVS